MTKESDKVGERIKSALNVTLDAALLDYGTFLNSYADRMVPIFTGELRRTMKVTPDGHGSIIVSTGEGLKYAKTQYYSSLRHAGSLEKLEPITKMVRTQAKRLGWKLRTGLGDSSRYSMLYKLWRYFYNPNPMQAPMWYHRALSNRDIRKRLHRAFVGKYVSQVGK